MEGRRRLDPEGYIVPEADLANVQPAYRGIPEAAADLLVRELGSRLHSGYLYGSVVRGNAVPGRSDLDLVAVLWSPAEPADRLAAARVEQGLVAGFPVLAVAGVALTHLEEVRSARQRYGLQVFLRDLSVCVCGQDLRPGLPATRRMVQAGFAVVMARDGAWATVLEEQAAAVGAAFPEWASAARRAAEQGRRPIADPRAVAGLLDTFGRWVEEELARVVAGPPPAS